LKAVLSISRLVGKNLTLPILSTVLFETIDDRLVLRATNLDIGAEISIKAKITEGGKIALPAQIIGNFLSGVGGGDEVQISIDNGNLKVTTGKHKTTIKGMPHDDFPNLPQKEGDETATIPGNQISLGIKAVLYAASQSDIKPEIASVYMYGDTGDIVFVATDSFRLAEKRIHLDKKQEFPKLIVPIRNASEISRLLEDYGENVLFGVTKNQLTIAGDDLYIVSRVVEGVFPDYLQIMPSGKTTEVVVLKEDFLGAIKTASLFADKFFQVKVSIDPTNAKFAVSSEGDLTGAHESNLDATLEGEPIEMSFNARYVLDSMTTIKEDSLVLTFNGKNKPMVIRGVGDNNFTYLAMPLNR